MRPSGRWLTTAKRFASRAPASPVITRGPSIGLSHLRANLYKAPRPDPLAPALVMASPEHSPPRKRARLEDGYEVAAHEKEEPVLRGADIVMDEPEQLDPDFEPGPKRTPNKKNHLKGKVRRPGQFPLEEHGNDGVIWREIISILGLDSVNALTKEQRDWEAPAFLRLASRKEQALDHDLPNVREIDVRVVKLGYNGMFSYVSSGISNIPTRIPQAKH